MSGPDPRNNPSYSGQPLRGSTIQNIRFDSRMIRSRRGSAISSISNSQTPYPCDSALSIHLAGHLYDPDQGGVPLTFPATEGLPGRGSGREPSSRPLSSRQSWTNEGYWNPLDQQEGGINLTNQADLIVSHPRQRDSQDRLWGYFLNDDFATTRPGNSGAFAASYAPALSGPENTLSFGPWHVPASNATAHANLPVQAASIPETNIAAAPSVSYSQPARELHHDGSAWVDYDVSDFLKHWDIQYHMGEAGLMHIDDERRLQWQPLIQGRGRPSGRDMQGLNWAALQTNRSRARLARKMLYPLRYSWTPPISYDERSLFRQQHMYAFKGFYGQHKAEHSHGQLRNVLAARSRNDIFYAARSKIMHTSLSCPTYTNVVLDFGGASTNPNQAQNTEITTIAVSHLTDFDGYYSDAVLVTGGLRGEYSVLNLNSAQGEAPTEGFVTTAEECETTHVHVLGHRRTSALGAVFCSNDSKVRVLDIETNSWLAEFGYQYQINCAATSPDGRLRAIVGDTCETLITDAERGDVLFQTRQHTGFGFACAWADDGWHVATGSEDGKVVVYDARRWDVPLAALACEMSCARSLHFTMSNRGGPALVVAESDDIVSVYDTMNWHNKQTMDFFGSVVGVAPVDNGQELIVANGDKTVGGLMVFDRRDHIPDEVALDELRSFNDQQYGDNAQPRTIGSKALRPKNSFSGFDDLMMF